MFKKLEESWTQNAYNLLSNLADSFCQSLNEQNVTIEDATEIANSYRTPTFQRTGAFMALIILLLRKPYQGRIIREQNYNYFLKNNDLDISQYIKELNSWASTPLVDLKATYMKLLVHIYKVERESGKAFEIHLEE